ncbi:MULTISPECIES: PTS system mannose/fructose/N-acetylgalactosamine-transporter subunit IIB [unclassified Caproiciproducens]|uniref:PTS system mannose/fructose/N-acetylgalactosamine-transporter subunit IIB n=1 Tax=unclassified Caproiciproducens TaxID=2643836 RepID=UPI0023DCB347|nr:PTS sugar transporter subunit IIB [Caproiciproducens sp. CPB-2]MDF1493635.1 PTS sugar transporter subunit IIB [Caproiciproducens sp. CPB-2]
MAIAVARIDERLVHGQIAYSWSVAYQVDTIIVVDDICAKDQMQKMLIGMAVPKGKTGYVFSVDETIQYFKSEKDLHQKIFLVAKGPEAYLKLVEGGVAVKSINVGGMYFKEGKKQLSKTVYVDDEDIRTFRKLQEQGVECEIRTAPSDKSLDLYHLC